MLNVGSKHTYEIRWADWLIWCERREVERRPTALGGSLPRKAGAEHPTVIRVVLNTLGTYDLKSPRGGICRRSGAAPRQMHHNTAPYPAHDSSPLSQIDILLNVAFKYVDFERIFKKSNMSTILFMDNMLILY